MGNMLRQIVAPLDELSLAKEPFLLVSKQLVNIVISQRLQHHANHASGSIVGLLRNCSPFGDVHTCIWRTNSSSTPR